MFVRVIPLGLKWPCPRCHQGHGQLSTDTYMQALNKTQVSDLGPLGPLVQYYFRHSDVSMFYSFDVLSFDVLSYT